jgi:hypothetical protein
LRFGQSADVVFNPAQDGVVVFVEVEDFHGTRLSWTLSIRGK